MIRYLKGGHGSSSVILHFAQTLHPILIGLNERRKKRRKA